MNPQTLLIAKETAAKLPWKWIIGGALAAGGLYLGVRVLRDQQAKDQDRRVALNQSSPAEIARLIYSYGAPGLLMWPRSAYTDEAALMALATQITDLNAVRIAYEQTYSGRRLLTDLQDWLSAEEYKLWLDIAQKP